MRKKCFLLRSNTKNNTWYLVVAWGNCDRGVTVLFLALKEIPSDWENCNTFCGKTKLWVYKWAIVIQSTELIQQYLLWGRISHRWVADCRDKFVTWQDVINALTYCRRRVFRVSLLTEVTANCSQFCVCVIFFLLFFFLQAALVAFHCERF